MVRLLHLHHLTPEAEAARCADRVHRLVPSLFSLEDHECLAGRPHLIQHLLHMLRRLLAVTWSAAWSAAGRTAWRCNAVIDPRQDVLLRGAEDLVLHHLEGPALFASFHLVSLLRRALVHVRVGIGPALDEVVLQALHDVVLHIAEVPAHRDPDNRQARLARDGLLELVLKAIHALHQWQAKQSRGEVLICEALLIHPLEQSHMSRADCDEEDEAEDVREDQVASLREEEAALRHVAECDDNAVLPRVLRTVEAERQKLAVDILCEQDPTDAHDQRPDDDGDLEVERQSHTGSCHIFPGHVRGERPQPAPLIALLRHAQLPPGPLKQGVRQNAGICDRPPHQVHKPRHHHPHDGRNAQKRCDPYVEEVAVTLAVDECVPGVALTASVRAIHRTLGAALHHA
mmetsp:Transcript_49044/g.140965  ORF Transcript_49044/g.140965 Transcript_49044/m.140965 type:complete len:401 (-) Transcript_49044:529-1731(-)